jgi:divalent metal cation (Fe/Co/Zn/Cd) transporter
MKKLNLPEPVQNVLRDNDLRSRYMLNLSLWANLLVAAFKLILGIAVQSFWLGAVGVFYGVLALMRFSLLRSFRRETPDAEQKAYRRTALLLNVLTLTMIGIFMQMIRDDQTYRYPGILIYVMAVWAFAKIIIAVKNLIQRRKEEQPILAAARCLSFAAALMSILALQTALISQFGGDAVDFAHTMNGIAGAVITALLITLSAMMLAKASKKDAH